MSKWLLLVAILISGCAHGQAAILCAIVAQPDAYAGKNVIVTATVLQDRHGAGLVDPHCPDALIALGSEGDSNPRFDKAYSANFGPQGQSIVASIQGQFVYIPGPYPVRRLDSYKVTDFHLAGPKPSR